MKFQKLFGVLIFLFEKPSNQSSTVSPEDDLIFDETLIM